MSQLSRSGPVEFDFGADLILENDRALLRPLTERDAAFMIDFVEKEPNLWRFSFAPPIGAAGMEAYIASALAGRAAKTAYPFVVFDKKTGEWAGSTRFYDMKLAHRGLALGYTWYGERFWGSGLNRQCKWLLLSHVFEKMGIERLEFHADSTNERSIAAMKAIGCSVEGILRRTHELSDGRWRDTIALSILREEWFEGGGRARLAKRLA